MAFKASQYLAILCKTPTSNDKMCNYTTSHEKKQEKKEEHIMKRKEKKRKEKKSSNLLQFTAVLCQLIKTNVFNWENGSNDFLFELPLNI